MNITFIGGGNMAQAIAGGLIRKGFDAKSICAVEPLAGARERLTAQLGVRAVSTVAEAASMPSMV